MQTVWNADLEDDDLFGVTVTDNSFQGFPIGHQTVGGTAGDVLYKRLVESKSENDLPTLGRLYSDFNRLGASNLLAMALFTSSGV